MVTSYKLLGEQIQRIYSRYIDKEDMKIDYREIKALLIPVINTLIKADFSAKNEVSGSTLATYELTAEKSGNISYVTMVASPMFLPKEQGVHRVYKTGCPWEPFIPIRSGDFDIVQGTPAQYLEGQTGYYVDGMKLIFTRRVEGDITVKQIVNDPSLIGDQDALPISPEMGIQAIQMVIQSFGMGQVAQAELNTKHEQRVTNDKDRW